MQEIEEPPPLSRWSHIWRIAAVILISGLAWAQYAQWQWDNNRGWLAADVLLGASAFILMFWRRRYPVLVAASTGLAAGLSSLAGGPATLALVSIATRRRWREILPVAAISLAAGIVLTLIDPVTRDSFALNLTVIFSVLAMTIGWGLYIGSRRVLFATLRDRAIRAEAEQAIRVEQARAAERGRIAREMHDVLAHRISLVSMHAGALAYRTDLAPEQIRQTAAIIQASSHQALAELREVLGILRSEPGDAAPERPQPAAEDLPDLIVEARNSGMRIDFNVLADLGDIPDGLGRTVYRIVQEGLTNARKHAAATLITVEISGSSGTELNVVISNFLPVGDRRLTAPESGLGLIGLAERTSLAGGRLTHRITSAREFILNASIPWPA